MDLENLTLEQTRKAIEEECHCILGDNMKEMLLGLVDRVEMAERNLAAVESQKPVATLREWTENGCSADYFDIHEHIPVGSDLYLGPVPADKPAVAVPDGWRQNLDLVIDRLEKISDGKNFSESLAAEALVCARALSAPSHSQQSDAVDLLRQIFELYEDGVDCYENPDEGAGYLGKAFRIDHDTYKLCVELLDSSEDRCPSHESEQLQTLRAHGLAENQQTEGE